jgi:hypothetical protein
MIQLTGLSIANPQAVMASFGLLRIVATQGLSHVTLQWQKDNNTACLLGLEWPQLVEILGSYLKDREQAPELNWADTIKGHNRDQYRQQIRTATPGELEWLESYWYEDLRKGDVVLNETKFDMTAGGQKLFSAVRKLIPKVRAKLEPALTEALIGPWLNNDNVGSFGWDPGAMKSGATITGGKAPTSAPDSTVIAAMWLAFEALPLFPTRWLARTGQYNEIEWALPHYPTTYAGLKQMMIAGLHMAHSELQAQGWSRWTVEVIRNGKFGCLLPAVRTDS